MKDLYFDNISIRIKFRKSQIFKHKIFLRKSLFLNKQKMTFKVILHLEKIVSSLCSIHIALIRIDL